MVFTKVDTTAQKEIAASYSITAMPTFLIFKDGKIISRIQGADPSKLTETVRLVAEEAELGSSEKWLGERVALKFQDVTDKIDLKNIEILNSDSEFGKHSTLFQDSKPSGLDAKGKGKATGSEVDWVESDTDEQLMIYMPFNSTLNIQAVQLTSVVNIFPTDEEKEEFDDSVPMLPKTLHFYTNLTYALGFDEAENLQPTQSVTLKPSDWNVETHTTNISLRFVKFQNVGSLVIFVVDGEGGRERVRLDRIRIIGETREQRNPGKLEKIGEDH
ncbi:MAG: Thioredoxin-like protein 1 [Trizodia sp. TS-e1964]|nr:MAG: Thioredoxin-like protein 1 [Trizodia sp. TS-e1964]